MIVPETDNNSGNVACNMFLFYHTIDIMLICEIPSLLFYNYIVLYETMGHISSDMFFYGVIKAPKIYLKSINELEDVLLPSKRNQMK